MAEYMYRVAVYMYIDLYVCSVVSALKAHALSKFQILKEGTGQR